MAMDREAVTPLRRLREERGLTLDAIAKPLGTHRGQISKIERFETEPPERYRGAYAMMLGVSIRDLGAIVYEGRHNPGRRRRKRRVQKA